jgi:hypothetical protein
MSTCNAGTKGAEAERTLEPRLFRPAWKKWYLISEKERQWFITSMNHS